MKVAIDKIKYRKRIIALFIGTFIFGMGAILVVVMNLLLNAGLAPNRILIVVIMVAIFSFFTYLIKFYYPLRKLDNAIIYENGVLNDYSKPFNKAINLKIQDIISISSWSNNKGINQYKIVTKNHNPKIKGLINQLQGNHIYLTDYIVSSIEFKKLVLLIESECA